ncbi:hypothetical protein DPEC_G00058980 [Dallia pectoralis]|uniref:Uncharacterized protein n=1 Tax=Dallia pectoralis TaxID=75939 RepID=A0ACC2H6Z2_DALPE|nr:hypothetical protein DPEC_G00058980 [Dallia pectoralis]
MECHSTSLEQNEPLARKAGEQQGVRFFKMARVGKRRKCSAHGFMDKARSRSCPVAGLTVKHCCGDNNQPVVLRGTGSQGVCWSPDRATTLRSVTSGQNPEKQVTVLIKLSGGGRTEIRCKEPNTQGNCEEGAPLKRDEWTPYSTAHQQIPVEGLVSKRTSAPLGYGNWRKKGTWRLDTLRWYSSLPVYADRGPMPFRRKRCVSMTASTSWADDQYWASWDGWDEVIIWGDEGRKEQRKKKPNVEERRKEGREKCEGGKEDGKAGGYGWTEGPAEQVDTETDVQDPENSPEHGVYHEDSITAPRYCPYREQIDK